MGTNLSAAEQFNLTSHKLGTLAEALREAAGKLREKQSYSLADIAETGSEKIMDLSNFFGGRDQERIFGHMEEFARNRPGFFFGAAMVAGFLLGQLFSSPEEREGAVQTIHSRRESSIEYRPGKDEEGYNERH